MPKLENQHINYLYPLKSVNTPTLLLLVCNSREGLQSKARNEMRTCNGKPDPEASGARPSINP